MNARDDIKKVWKSWMQPTSPGSDDALNITGGHLNAGSRRRGSQVYNVQQIMGTSGVGKNGKYLTGGVEYPLFRITVQQRTEFVKMCGPLQGLITSRMQKVCNTPFSVKPIRQDEDREYDKMKTLYSVCQEFEGLPFNDDTLKYVLIREKSKETLLRKLPELLPDLSNFDSAILRWKKKIQNKHTSDGEKIKEWLQTPNGTVRLFDYFQKMVFDLHVHGAVATYKKAGPDGKLESFDTLPGGSVYKIKERYYTSECAYIQIIQGLTNQFFYSDEMAYLDYLPTSCQSYPLIPIEAVLNKVIGYLLYDMEMASQADGTRPPEKILAVAKKTASEFAEYDAPPNLRMDPADQKRLETKINEPRRYPVMVLDNLNGDVMEVIDISKENIMQILDMRQDKMKQDIATVYNAMPFEVGLTGSDFTSGRETSESQLEHAYGKGLAPILYKIESMLTHDILPYRFGYGYKVEFEKSKNELEERQLDQIKLANGEMTTNELRESKGLSMFEGDQFNYPAGSAPVEAGSNELNPMHIKEV
jgi:hypothetical protein